MGSGRIVVLLPGRRFDAEELLDTVDRERVASVVIVGDVFGTPMVEALEAFPDRWDLSSVRVLASTGAMWTAAIKEALGSPPPSHPRRHAGLVGGASPSPRQRCGPARRRPRPASP